MSSHSLTLFLQRKRGNGYRLVSGTPVFHDFMGLMERVVDNTFDYMNCLETLEPKQLPAAIKKSFNVDAHNFYVIEAFDFYNEMENIVRFYGDELTSLCKSLGFTRTFADEEEICLGKIKGKTTLPVNADLVVESIRKRNRAMSAEYIQGLLQAWVATFSDNGKHSMADFRFIAAYDY